MTVAFIALLLTALPAVAPHMFVLEPRSRNYVANQSGEGTVAGKPVPEYTPQGLNSNTKVCGREGGTGINYDTWNDSLGNPMPWVTQGTYAIGGHVQIDILMTAHHLGHFEVKACAMGRDSTQGCFDEHPLEFVKDKVHGMPKDINYPERAMLFGDGVDLSYKMKLPDDIAGQKVLLQIIYWTANSCSYLGYKEYFTNSKTPSGNKPNWSPGLIDCPVDLPTLREGAEAVTPEIFVNCAEITIEGEPTPTAPIAPTAPSPTPAPAPTPVAQEPVDAPVTTGKLPPVDPDIDGTCGTGDTGNGICPAQTLCCSKFGYCGTIATKHCDSDPRFIPTPPCVDLKGTVYKNKKNGKKKKRTCKWVGENKKCNKRYEGEKLKISCPVTCGMKICE